jgi:protein phosphatase
VQYGLLTGEQARTHARRHVLTRCLGRELIVGIDVLTLDLRPGDGILQCSDGVHGYLRDEELCDLLEGSPEAACRAMIQCGRERGGEDNLSVQIAVVVDCPAPAPRPWWRLRR